MKPLLVIGLGNPLMGDDGVGWHVARQLADDPRLPAAVEVIDGGTDLLRCEGQMDGRQCILVVDAVSGDDSPGSVRFFEDELPADGTARQAHDLSAVEAIQLCRRFWKRRIVLITVAVCSAEAGGRLSQAVSAALPGIVDQLLVEIGRVRDPL